MARAGSYFAAIVLVCLNYWINRYFGRPDIDQIAYHLQFGTEGLEASDPAIVRRFVRWSLVIPLVLLATTLLVERWALAWRHRALVLRAWPVLPKAALLAGILPWLYQLSVLDYLASSRGPDYFATHYVAPSTVAVDPASPKNLVLIYVESMEAGYSSRRLFGDDLIAPLTALGTSGFDAFVQVPGTGWTVAAMVATQCALPLKRVTLFDENTQGEQVRSFLPNATCLGDILAGYGYRNVFMGGGSPSFAGKGRFLRAHHYHEVYGKEDWQAQGVPETMMNGWGLFDDALLARARDKLDALHAAGQPFNLTLLTVDTHEPAGHLSRSCARRGHAGLEGVLRCTAGEVAAFVSFVRERGYLADTHIVILGDHLARRNALSDVLERIPERTLFNAFIGADPPPRNRSQLVHFDLLPTILEFSGFSVSGGRLGLGYSGFNRHGARPAPGRLAEMRASVLNRSDLYRSLWLAAPPAQGAR
ncbi:MAG: phosphatidylglycerol--membrane-oligosaccharide glycerophosphotransferase [Lysobacteraceae bacterium]|nr:MAG: phosphatidylglycerol--membrane-oligosaccharide glycerophosphotransferase [Xanthomonadaceae bacterium]